jgi:hypothetical protein
MMIAATLVLPETTVGMIEASIALSASHLRRAG